MKTSKVLITSVTLGVLIAGAVFIYRGYSLPVWGGYGGYHRGPGMFGHWGMGFLMPLFWVLVIAWVFSMLNRATGGSGQSQDLNSSGPDAVEILKQRYARGEIDKTEFRSTLTDLQNK